ncbi:hypothetical protein T492DRAFT_294864 [Pavlovales sp. CCMP2436]|nr:hypothetical protein T492DRAFT_294864 [Pavlovales sp. CCMP2436]
MHVKKKPDERTYARTHARAHTHTHTHARTHARAHTHARTRTHTRTRTRTHARTHTHTCTHAHTRTHAHNAHAHTHLPPLLKFRVRLGLPTGPHHHVDPACRLGLENDLKVLVPVRLLDRSHHVGRGDLYIIIINYSNKYIIIIISIISSSAWFNRWYSLTDLVDVRH